MNLLIPNLPQQLSFSKSLSTPQCHFLHNNLSFSKPTTNTIIRMGGGPRTYPGGVSKWQWKRMQAKKAKQLLKARLCRERQIYEMRKRAELKAAVSELERPWEVVEKAPNLFYVGADEQVKVLADRFQKPGGFDLWSEKDGPQLFETPDELPSARFFPKGVVHSVRPYRKVGADDELVEDPPVVVEDDGDGDEDGGCFSDLDSEVNGVNFDGRLSRKGNEKRFLSKGVDGSDDREGSSHLNYGRNGVSADGRMRKNGNGRRFLSKGVDNGSDGECSYPLNYGRNGVNVDGRKSKNGNGSRFMSKGVDESDGERSSSLNSGGNGVNLSGRMKKNGNGRKFLSKDVDGSDDGECSSPPLSSGKNGVSFDGRLRKKGNGKRFMSRDVDGSNGLYSGRVGSGRNQRGSNSIEGRSARKYSRGTSGYPSRRVRDADSEVYDMGLQQDGSYGFLQKSEQSDSKSW